jgi:hypothetical protein
VSAGPPNLRRRRAPLGQWIFQQRRTGTIANVAEPPIWDGPAAAFGDARSGAACRFGAGCVGARGGCVSVSTLV